MIQTDFAPTGRDDVDGWPLVWMSSLKDCAANALGAFALSQAEGMRTDDESDDLIQQ